MGFSAISTSDYAAWWGAIIATIVMVLQLLAYFRSGPRVTVTATSDAKVFPKISPTGDKTFISVKAINRGNAPTTLTNFLGYFVQTSLLNVLKNKRQYFVVNDLSYGNPVPFQLDIGQEWHSKLDQQKLLEQFGHGLFFIGIEHNQKTTPIYQKIKL